jgi:hypothetical protein
MRTARGRSLIYLATVLSLGHHLDHVLRGDHTGWPLSDDVTPFTYSLAVYPLILLGLFLSLDAGYWMLLSGPGALFLAAVHLGPTALEPPQDIVDPYANPVLGWLAFAWLLILIAVLSAMFVYEARLWRRPEQN